VAAAGLIKAIVRKTVTAFENGAGLQMQFQVGAQHQKACPVYFPAGQGDPTAAVLAAGIDGSLDGGSVIVDAVAHSTEGQNIVLHIRHSLHILMSLV
jgi:hypothetical protein